MVDYVLEIVVINSLADLFSRLVKSYLYGFLLFFKSQPSLLIGLFIETLELLNVLASDPETVLNLALLQLHQIVVGDFLLVDLLYLAFELSQVFLQLLVSLVILT